MATVKIISVNQLIKMFSDFADAHLQLNGFGYGPTSDIGRTNQMEFPYLWATHRGASKITVNNKTQIPQLTMTFLVVDQINIQKNYLDVNGLDGDNQQEIISDTLQIVQDFVTYISSELNRYGVKLLENDITVEPVFDETPDKVSGWVIDLDIQLTHSNCAYPLGIVPVIPNNCPSTIVRNSDGSYSITAIAGSIVDLPDITHTQTDGSPTILPAQTPMVCDQPRDSKTINSDGSYQAAVPAGGLLTLPDIDVVINGITFDTIPSVIDAVIPVKDEDGISVGSEINGEWIVPTGAVDKVAGYIRPFNGTNTSYYDGDDGWYNANNWDTYVFDPNTMYATVQDPTNWYKLLNLNSFGNNYRFTSENGGYFDETDSTYKDVNGLSTTYYAEFQYSIANPIDLVINGTFDTNSDWDLPRATIGGGTLNLLTTDNYQTCAEQFGILTDSHYYSFTFNITNYVSGSVKLITGTNASGDGSDLFTGNGICSGIVQAKPGEPLDVSFISWAADTDMSIDNLVMVDITNNNGVNLLRPSNDFRGTSWVKSSVVTTAEDSIAPPIGTSITTELTTTVDFGNLVLTTTVPTGGNYTYSCYAKASVSDLLILRSINFDSSPTSSFDLINGVVHSTGAISATIDDIGNGWYRCSHTFNTTSDLTGGVRIQAGSVATSLALAGDSIFIFGAQLESGNTATTYNETSLGGRAPYVVDNLTGMGWQSASGAYGNFNYAFNYLSGINSAEPVDYHQNYTDWKCSSLVEIYKIMRPDLANGGLVASLNPYWEGFGRRTSTVYTLNTTQVVQLNGFNYLHRGTTLNSAGDLNICRYHFV